jgi:hypothetical protein
MEKGQRQQIEEMEAHSRYPTGIGQIERGKCPKGATSPLACAMCLEGHLLECHAGMTCRQAQCNHFFQEEETFKSEVEPNIGKEAETGE